MAALGRGSCDGRGKPKCYRSCTLSRLRGPAHSWRAMGRVAVKQWAARMLPAALILDSDRREESGWCVNPAAYRGAGGGEEGFNTFI